MTTIRDVAKFAGVSPTTVSRVLNESGYVNVDTKRKVLDVIDKLNFEPNTVAKGLASKKTYTIALIIPDITNPFFPALARAIEDSARKYGFTVMLCNSDDEAPKQMSYLKSLIKRYVDGIIIATQMLDKESYGQLVTNDIPVVMLDRAVIKTRAISIRSKNFEGAQMAFNHLADIGCKKIAHIYGPPHIQTAKERLEGYEQLAKKHDWYSPSLLAPGYFKVEGGVEATYQLINKHPDIDGIFAGNDVIALGALKALLQMGKRVPEDVALCGFDGIALTRLVEPEITTIEQPIYKIGEMAVEFLIDKINGKLNEDIVHEFDVVLRQRKSTLRR